MKSRLTLFAAIALLVLALSSCALPTRNYTDDASAQAYLLHTMQQRYGLDFTISYEPHPPGVNSPGVYETYSMWVYQTGYPDRLGRVSTPPMGGEVKDSWSINLFRDEIEAPFKATCNQFRDALRTCSFEATMSLEPQLWKPGMTYEEFRAAAPRISVYVDVTFDVHDVTSNAPVVKQLLDHLHTTASTVWSFDVLFDRDGEEILSFRYHSGNPVPSLDDLLNEMD